MIRDIDVAFPRHIYKARSKVIETIIRQFLYGKGVVQEAGK